MLKISRALPFLLLGLPTLLTAGRLDAGLTAVVVRDISILDPTEGRWLPHRDLIVNDTAVTAVFPTGRPLPDAKFTINGDGKFAIPGLFDNAVSIATINRQVAGLFIVWGVTSVRDVGSSPEVVADWRRDLGNGKFMGPRVVGTSPRIDGALPAGAAGRDGAIPGASLQQRLIRSVRAGAKPAEALRLATIDSARAGGRGNDLGSIEPGKLADFIVLDGDPLSAIENLSAIDAVVFRGEVLTRAHLNQLQSKAGRLPQ